MTTNQSAIVAGALIAAEIDRLQAKSALLKAGGE